MIMKFAVEFTGAPRRFRRGKHDAVELAPVNAGLRSIVFAVGFLAALSSALPIARAVATPLVLPMSYETTLFGSMGGSDCFSTLAVSESAHRLFALDACNSQVAIYDTLTLTNLGTVPVSRAGTSPLMLAVGHHPDGAGAGFDDHVFISDADGLRVSDAASLAPITDVAGTLSTSGGFDDGFHMVVDTVGQRIFVTDHDLPLRVFDFALNPLAVSPGVILSEPLGIAALPDGTLFVTDENEFDGLFRVNPDLSLDAQVPTAGWDGFFGAEGIALAVDSGLVFVADEDDGEVEIFDAATLAWVGDVNVNFSATVPNADGPYWLGVDEGANRLFLLADSLVGVAPGDFGVHVYVGASPAPVPEPSTLAIFAFGLAGLGFLGWRRRKELAAA